MDSTEDQNVLENEEPTIMYSAPNDCRKYLYLIVGLLVVCALLLTYYVMVKISGFAYARDPPTNYPTDTNEPEFVKPFQGKFMMTPEEMVAVKGSYEDIKDFEYASGHTKLFENLNTKIKEGPNEDVLWAQQHHNYPHVVDKPLDDILI